MSLLMAGGLVPSILAASGCGSIREDNANNPSHHVVTAQVESIESAMGTQGGLGVPLQQSGGHGEGPALVRHLPKDGSYRADLVGNPHVRFSGGPRRW